MRQVYIIPILILTMISAKAQTNLVPNSSFEKYSAMSSHPSIIDLDVNSWFVPSNNSTPNYHCTDFNSAPSSIAGFQYAYHGNAYISMTIMSTGADTNTREYVQAKLSEPLVKDKKYCVSLYASLSDYSSFGTNNLAAFFSKDTLHGGSLNGKTHYVIHKTPQVIWNNKYITDTAKWIHFTNEFFAEGGEQFLTIGNFSYDVENDTIWTGSITHPDPPGVICFAFIDLVSVYYCGPDTTPAPIKKISIYPNPSNSDLYIEFKNISFDNAHLFLYDVFGRIVYNEAIFETTQNNAIIDISPLSTGTYFYYVQAGNGMWKKGKLVKI